MVTAVRVPNRRANAAPTITQPDGSARRRLREFGRAVIDSVVNRRGGSFSVELPSTEALLAVSSRLEAFLLALGAKRGGASARVAPGFLADTFPAMLALTRLMDRAGLEGAWTAEHGRTVRLGEARQVFVSVDRPGTGDRGAPDALLELIGIGRIGGEWYRTRVMPRAGRPGLTRVFYGICGDPDPLFASVRRRNLHREAELGSQRHFPACNHRACAARGTRAARPPTGELSAESGILPVHPFG